MNQLNAMQVQVQQQQQQMLLMQIQMRQWIDALNKAMDTDPLIQCTAEEFFDPIELYTVYDKTELYMATKCFFQSECFSNEELITTAELYVGMWPNNLQG